MFYNYITPNSINTYDVCYFENTKLWINAFVKYIADLCFQSKKIIMLLSSLVKQEDLSTVFSCKKSLFLKTSTP